MVAEAISFFKENYNDEREYAHGCYCEFMPKCRAWGIKIYQDKEKRDTNLFWQEKAANAGLGPDVGGRFNVKVGGKTHYCYLTEIVEPLWDSKRDNEDWELNFKLNEEWRDEMIELMHDLADIGFDFSDRHVGNVAFKNGRMICIDFGEDD